MSRTSHFLIRLLLALALCACSGIAQEQFIVLSKQGISQIAKRHGLRVVTSLPGSASGTHVVSTNGQDSQQVLRRLASDANVQSVEADQPVLLPGIRSGAQVHPAGAAQGLALPLDGAKTWYYTSQAANGYINQPAASLIGITRAHDIAGGDAKVAVIDTGIDRTNLVLAPSISDGWDFVHNFPLGGERADVNQETTPILDQETTPILDQETTPILDGGTAVILNQETTPILDQETTPILDSRKFPAYGHGTMVAGLIHLVAPKAKLMAVRVFASDGTASISQIVAGIYWAIDHGANVINMSFSTRQNSPALAKAIDDANARGIICVASAGNDGQTGSVWPAAYSNVIGVAATDNFAVRSLFSNYGSQVSLAAPGEALVTTYPSTNWGQKQHYAEVWGTSFSAPLVSGAAALLVEAGGIMNNAQVEDIFSRTSMQVGNQGLGAGELNVFQAASFASKNRKVN